MSFTYLVHITRKDIRDFLPYAMDFLPRAWGKKSILH